MELEMLTMGVVPWVDRRTFLPNVGSGGVLPPCFSGVDIFVLMHTVHWVIGAIFVKFSQLILMKIIEIVATRYQILRLKCTKFNFAPKTSS